MAPVQHLDELRLRRTFRGGGPAQGGIERGGRRGGDGPRGGGRMGEDVAAGRQEELLRQQQHLRESR